MKTALRELDSRPLPAASREKAVLEAFDRLSTGAAFVLTADLDPRPTFDLLRTRHPDILGWIPVLKGPPLWKVEVQRLMPKDDEREIGAYFARDHDEIDVLFENLRTDLSRALADPTRPVPPLQALYRDFDARLERHIRWEEEILFPAVEAKSPPLLQGPGRVMREEHRGIRGLKAMAAGQLALAERDRSALVGARQALEDALRILLDHNRKEEGIYYPMSDEMFPPAEAARLLKRVREMR